MAVRRPPAPRLRPGRPGVAPVHPVMTPPAADTELCTNSFQERGSGSCTTSAKPLAGSTPAAAPTATAPTTPAPARPRPRRRTVLVAGAAAVVVPVGAAAVAHRSASTSAFTDVAAGSETADAIRWASDTGVQPPLTVTAYGPEEPVARGDLALALHRFAGSPTLDLAAAPALFTDLPDDDAQATALAWLHGRGALWGDAELRVRPAETATRDEAATMLAALLRPALTAVGARWDTGTLPEQADGADDADLTALADLAWLTAAGMVPTAELSGAHDGAAPVTRQELAVALHRADRVVEDALG